MVYSTRLGGASSVQIALSSEKSVIGAALHTDLLGGEKMPTDGPPHEGGTR